MKQKVFDVLQEQLRRLKKAEVSVQPTDRKEAIIYKPFFYSLIVKRHEGAVIETRNGGTNISRVAERPIYFGRLEARVGDYEKGGGVAHVNCDLTADLDYNAALRDLWLSSNEAIWESCKDFDARFSDTWGLKENRDQYVFFSREKPQKFIDIEKSFNPDMETLEKNLKIVSRVLANNSKVINADTDFSMYKEDTYLLNSEGSRIYTSFMKYVIIIGASAPDPKNQLIQHRVIFRGRDLAQLPSLEEMLNATEKLKQELFEIIKAPIEENGIFPAILCPENHGVLWHEVIGHALEGDHMQADQWGNVVNLFKDKIDKQIAPDFLSLHDDPTREELNGHYLYDDDGVEAKRVKLVENGILKDYLHSRESAGYFRTQSNGHSRAQRNKIPVARMSNLIVESSNEVSVEELKENLIRLCKGQKKPYGLRLKKSMGGSTLPENSSFDSIPAQIFRIYPNGKEERVRGVYIVGTPYQALQNIIQTSDRYEVSEGTCGAESGWLPVAEYAPDALLGSIEVNRLPRSEAQQMKEPILPRPKFKK